MEVKFRNIIESNVAFRLFPRPTVPLWIGARSAGIYRLAHGWRQPQKTVDYLEMFWCISGTFEFPLTKENRKILLQSDEVMFLLPGDFHGQQVCSSTAEYCWLTFDGHVKELVEAYQLVRSPFHAGKVPRELFLRLIDEISGISMNMQYLAVTTAMQIMHIALVRRSENATPLLVAAFTQSVEEQCRKPECTVEQLARQLGISRITLYRLVCQTLGCTPKEYIDRSRLRAAMQLLSGTQMTINEISSRCGFVYPNYFSRIFRKRMNCTPENFRKNSGRNG